MISPVQSDYPWRQSEVPTVYYGGKDLLTMQIGFEPGVKERGSNADTESGDDVKDDATDTTASHLPSRIIVN